MSTNQPPIKVIFDPDFQTGFPGDTLEFHAIVYNQGDLEAEIELLLDLVSPDFSKWFPYSRAKIALAPQQNGRVTFIIRIPFDALPRTYDYALIVDSPKDYIEDTPIQYPRQLKVLPLQKEEVARPQYPTFTIDPATNPDSPSPVKPGQTLQFSVTVNNRCDRVNRFYLSCSDLDQQWFTIKYPKNKFQNTGIISQTDGVELNPQEQGQIIFELYLPSDVPAGCYSPTLNLTSFNDPDSVLHDSIYFQVPPTHLVDVELKQILGKVSHQSAQYQLQLMNQGNMLRELEIDAKSQDEDELCHYTYQRSPIQLPIGSQINVDLRVKPVCWWRRPLFGTGLKFPFQLELRDLQELPLSKTPIQGMLLWKARPWWQLLLILLVCLSLIFGLGLIIWLIFFNFLPKEVPRFIEGMNFGQGLSSQVCSAARHIFLAAQL